MVSFTQTTSTGGKDFETSGGLAVHHKEPSASKQVQQSPRRALCLHERVPSLFTKSWSAERPEELTANTIMNAIFFSAPPTSCQQHHLEEMFGLSTPQKSPATVTPEEDLPMYPRSQSIATPIHAFPLACCLWINKTFSLLQDPPPFPPVRSTRKHTATKK